MCAGSEWRGDHTGKTCAEEVAENSLELPETVAGDARF